MFCAWTLSVLSGHFKDVQGVKTLVELFYKSKSATDWDEEAH